MSARHVLVTGGAGFIGSHLVEALVARGDRVRVLDSFDPYYDPAVKRRNLASVVESIELVEGDLRDRDLVGRVVQGTDCVVHLAARAGVRSSLERPVVYMQVNVAGTQRLLEAMRDAGVNHLVAASSSSVYGARTKGPFRESDALGVPASPYAASKQAMEIICQTWQQLFDLQLTMLRFFTVYGPRQRPDMAFHIFLRALLRADEEITVFGDGTQTREVTYIQDAVDATLLAIGTDRIGHTFNVGGGTYRDLNGYLEELETVAGRRFRRRAAPVVEGDQLHSRADVTQARDVLGYSPGWSLRDGLQAEFDWLRTIYDDPG